MATAPNLWYSHLLVAVHVLFLSIYSSIYLYLYTHTHPFLTMSFLSLQIIIATIILLIIIFVLVVVLVIVTHLWHLRFPPCPFFVSQSLVCRALSQVLLSAAHFGGDLARWRPQPPEVWASGCGSREVTIWLVCCWKSTVNHFLRPSNKGVTPLNWII